MKRRSKNGGEIKPRKGWLVRLGGLVCLVAATASTAGCYGRFPMTHALYNMNGGVNNGVVRNVVFWLLVWFPVYWFAQIGDAIIFNLIEFWTGSEIDLGAVSTEGGTTVTLRSSEDRDTLFMTVSKPGEPDAELRFIRLEDGTCEMRDDQDRLVGNTIRTPAGSLVLTDGNGRPIQTISAIQLAAISDR